MHNNNLQNPPTIINSKGNEAPRPDCGEVPRDMPEPSFLADPGHRKKTLKGKLCRFAGKKVAENKTMTKCDCVRMSTNFAHMSRTLPLAKEEEHVDRAKAAPEHHFDNHLHCGSFCHRKDQSAEELAASTKCYRHKDDDKELYNVLHDLPQRFLTLDALKEVGHGMDTLVNESLNNSISWLAPKNKTHSTTQSLRNRISVAVGINALGIYNCFARLFKECGVDMQDDVAHYLKQMDARRTCRILKSQETDQKKKHQENFHKMLQEHTEAAKKQKCKRDGSVCQPGIGMGECCAPTSTTNQRGKHDPNATCSKCKETGHKRSTNKLCKCYTPPKRKSTTATAEETQAQLERDAREQDVMDSLPFVDGDDEFFDSFEDMDDDEGAAGII